MNLYKNILVAVDLSQDSAVILDKARGIAKSYEAQLDLIHVIEPIAVGYAIEISSIDVEGLHQEATEQAKQSLMEMGRNIDIPAERMHTLLGQPAREIKELANEIEADLIIMGNHGRHGWELLFGSTSTGVAHGINCDLLTVHI
ncbi:MAG: universal stress protein [Gammaproteobacteria bacterium]|jgi:universal stress protein A|nr:universal stress protein [Gammaproteobacteria bacterium]